MVSAAVGVVLKKTKAENTNGETEGERGNKKRQVAPYVRAQNVPQCHEAAWRSGDKLGWMCSRVGKSRAGLKEWGKKQIAALG